MNEAMDRLSELHDSLIHHIFSFLPMEDVVRTTILSTRWVDLWTTVPYLSFEAKSGELDKFRNFVNWTMMLWKGTKIHKFSIKSRFPDISFHHDLNVWVRLAVQHKVEELYLCYLFEDTGWLLPQCLFSSSSITKLSLQRDDDIIFNGKIHWDQVKTLRIDNFDVDQSVIDNVLLGSPRLELLDLYCGPNLNISSTSLKKLFIHYDADDYYAEDDEIDSELHIWAPNLQVLRIKGSVCNEFLVLFLPSLIEAILTFHRPNDLSDEFDGDMLRDIFKSIDHVEKLVVGYWFIQVFQVMEKTALPSPLLNLKHLTIYTAGNGSLAGVVNLLEISPNIAMLTIKNNSGVLDDEKYCVFPEVELSDTILMNLRIVDIELYTDTLLFSIAKFVLKNASALEKIVIKGNALVDEMQELLRMPGYSTNAEVVLQMASERKFSSTSRSDRSRWLCW